MKTLVSFAALLVLAGVAWTHVASGPATSPTAAKLNIDSGHSSVVFRTKHLGVATFWGRFNKVSGEVMYDEADPSKCSISIAIDANSVDTNDEQRDAHLKNADFFSAGEFPEITFESKSVKAKGDKLMVRGELTLRGVTKEITVEAEKVGGGETFMGKRHGFDARFSIDGTDYDLAFMKSRPGALGPKIELFISLECTE